MKNTKNIYTLRRVKEKLHLAPTKCTIQVLKEVLQPDALHVTREANIGRYGNMRVPKLLEHEI